MSMVTFGPPVAIDGPLPVAPTRSLLTVPGVLQTDRTLNSDGDLVEKVTLDAAGDPIRKDRWMNGVAVYGYPDSLPDVWEPCETGTFAVKTDESSFQTPDFGSFVAYVPITCSSFSLASDPDGFAQRSEVALDAVISYAVERALAAGVPLPSSNPYLTDSNVQVLGSGAAQTPYAALSYLEDAIGQTARQGMIHATPGVVSSWFATFPMQESLSSLYTPVGTVVSAGGGYYGATPFGESAAAAGQSWAFATGPVRVWIADEATLDIKDVLDRSDNVVTFRAEKYALVEWDTSLQAAVLVDWGACPCPS